ncbi:hypothetical protein cypCar_00000354 [Cyprinus carpio]|nr:hypothetical protein cypCar_00000354 [Cyprinus carpio]
MAAAAGHYYSDGGRATKRQKTDSDGMATSLWCSFESILCYVVLMPKKRQALVEFEDMNGSSNAVTYANNNQIYIAGRPSYINYSTSQKISRPSNSDDTRSVNSVLLLTIMNPIYPITTDVLYTICNNCGPVQRIVIFRKNGVQAMVEYP